MTPTESAILKPETAAPASADLASLTAALESAGVGTWTTDLRTGLTRCSPLNYQLFGLPRHAPPLPHEAWLERVHPDDRGPVLERWTQARAGLQPYALEYRTVLPDGTVRWIESRARFRFDGAGEPIEVSGVSLDVTERHAAQAAAEAARAETERQRRLYEAILGNTPDLAYVFDLQHRFVYANEGLLRMWGRTWEEAIGKTCLELGYEPWHAEMHDREIEQVIATREPIRGEVPFTGTFGQRIYDYIFVPVLTPDGRVEAVAGTTRDVTAYKERQRRRDEFLATLSHELRNPLAPLSNAVQLLARQDDPQIRAVHALMARQLQHLVRLVDDLLDVSRISRGSLELRLQPLVLTDAVRSALDTSSAAIEAAGVRLQTHWPEQPPWVEGDPVRLAQVVANLLNNAAAYTPRGGTIELALGSRDQQAWIRVRDSGEGIAADELATIFEMFGRGASAGTRAPQGLGVGLALARMLTELHGGRLEAASDGPGRGSEFRVRLPLRPPPPREDAASPDRAQEPAARPLAQRRILIVDDNADAAETLAALLTALGATARAVHSGAQALALLAHFDPELALLDLGMPEMDGYELARRIRARGGPPVFLVALTGWGQQQDRLRTAAAGFDDHLVKPVEVAQIRALRCFQSGPPPAAAAPR